MKKYSPLPYTFFIDKVVLSENAVIPVMTNALQYGKAFFSGIRGFYNNGQHELSIFRLHDHYKRFMSSSKILGVNIKYTIDELIDITIKLTKKNNPKTNVYFRPFAYASSLNILSDFDYDNTFDFALYMVPLDNDFSTANGLNVCVSSWQRVSDNAIPTRAKISGVYINSALARKEATGQGFDEAIFLNNAGHVAEGSAENFFMVRDGVLITPPVYEDILEGITRDTILQLAHNLGIPTKERPIDRSELYVCDEAFFSATALQVSWIKKIDGRIVGNGKRGQVTKKLQDVYTNVLQGQNLKYAHWYSKITLK